MAIEKDEVLKANQGAPAADIPDLKKKDKERKKAGATWSGAQGGAGSFSGATGGTVARAAASAAGAAGEAAAVGAAEAASGGFGAMIARVLAGLTSTLLGKMAVAAAAFLMMGAAGLLGYGLLKGGGGAGTGSLNLGGITDSLKVRAGGNDRLSIAGGGEIRFDPLSRNAPPKPAPKADEAKPEDKTAEAAAPDKVDAAKGAPQDQLAHNLSGAKLSTSLGGNFGNKNIFAGSNGMAPKFDISKAGMPKMAAAKGQMGAMKPGAARSAASARSVGRGKTGRAIGQLKLAKGMSMLGAGANTAEQAASSALGAFDQQQTVGGELAAHAPSDMVTSPSSPNTPNTSMPNAPVTPTSTSTNPNLQNAMDQIGKMADAARQMKKTGEMLMAIGAVLMLIGGYLIKLAVATSPWGAGLMIAGIALLLLGGGLIYMGMEMMSMASKMAEMAKTMGSTLAAQIGNNQQAAVINTCTDQALNGTPTSQCNNSSVTNTSSYNSENTTGVDRVRHLGDDKPVLGSGQ